MKYALASGIAVFPGDETHHVILTEAKNLALAPDETDGGASSGRTESGV